MLRKIYTVGEITEYIKRAIENANIKDVWVDGEVSNFRHAIGHYFFYLKDENAVLRCVMFSPSIPYEIKNGMRVIVKGDVRVYEKKGIYQMYVKEIKIGGVGELFLKFLEIKEKLRKEGLFDEKYKKKLPPFPEKIGVVTSPNGAAIKDITNVIKRRFPVTIVLAPARVQGEEAKEEIINAIKMLNRRDDIDLIIVGRGGGSWEDLWPFNTEEVARAIFGSRIPIISAVGHETDFTIADFVADARAPTPSAAAEMAVPDMAEVERRIASMEARIIKMAKAKIDMERNFLNGLLSRKAMLYPFELLQDKIYGFNEAQAKLRDIVSRFMEEKKKEMERKMDKLQSLDPYAILQRGYSIAFLENGEIFKSVDDVRIGDTVKIVVKDGEAKCRVKEKKRR